MRTLRVALLVSLIAGIAHLSPREATALRTVLWTNPSTNVSFYPYIDPDTGESFMLPDCYGFGDPLQDLAAIKVWRWPATPGARPFVYAVLNVRGREGLTDSTQVPEDGAHYYLTAVDTTGGNETCPSNVIYLGPVTDVPTGDPPPDRIVEMKIFDLHGRLVRSRTASGIYFYRARWRSGRITSGKLPPLLR